ncbi:hypothetical protein LG293_15870 (plasmid) [Citricoccus nitrophenolicus]
MSLANHEALSQEVQELEKLGDPEDVLALVHQLRNQRLASASLRRSMMSLAGGITPAAALRLASTESLWKKIDEEFGLLSAEQVSQRVGASKGYASDARRHGRLLGVKRLRSILYPAFQFDQSGVLPLMRQLIEVSRRHEVPEEAVLLWMASPTTWWGDDARPVDHLDDEAGILGAFQSRFGTEW